LNISIPPTIRANEAREIYFNEVDKGGHFAAWERPELFNAELRAAFGSLRQSI
jgi:pimeloyl-ACP methyl ester carboxylesterase